MQVVEQSSFEPLPPQDSRTTDPLVVHRRPGAAASAIVILVHGWGGSRYGTWGRWPEFLFEDLYDCDVGLYDYVSGTRRWRITESVGFPSMEEHLAHTLRDLPYQKIVLAGHSLGGLLCQSAICHLIDTMTRDHQGRLGVEKIATLFLLGTPQAGTRLVLPGIGWLTTDLRVLRPGSRYVQRIVRTFADRVAHNIRTAPHDEQFLIPTYAVTGTNDWVVRGFSARLSLPTDQVKVTRASHRRIVKPQSRDNEAYSWVADRLRSLVAPPGPRLRASSSSSGQLPIDIGSGFTGRQNELARLIPYVRNHQGPGPAMVSIDGPPGVGKTTLARRLVTELSPDFPDGVLYRDLRGLDKDEQTSSEAALRDFLRERGIDVKAVSDPTASYHSVLRGQRVLVFLDNATDGAHVDPLLPSEPGCAVLITSRRRLALAGAEPCSLKPYSEGSGEGVQLLHSRLRPDIAPADRTKMLAEANETVRLCGNLPLAISQAAAVANRYRLDLAELRERLEDSPLEGIEASFQLSYDALPSKGQQLFRLLGAPGLHDLTAWGAAALLGLPQTEAKPLLDGLTEMSLLTGVIDACGVKRYKLFDLLRVYARERLEHETPESDRRNALDRLAVAYYGCVNYAFNLRNADNPMVDGAVLPGWRAEYPGAKAAVDGAKDLNGHVHPEWWFAAERENLLGLVELASKANPPLPITPKLASSLFYFLEMGGYWEEWRAVDRIGLAVAEKLHDKCARARSLRNLGRLEMVLVEEQQERLRDDQPDGPDLSVEIPAAGDCAHAVSLLQESCELYRQCMDGRGGEATTLRELADADRLQGRLTEALDAYEAAERAFRMLPPKAAANAIASLQLALGRTYKLRGESEDVAVAERCFRQGFQYASQRDQVGKPHHPRLMGYALRRLADLYRDQGQLERAVEYYDQCVAVFESFSDAKSAARAMAERGRVLTHLPNGLDRARSSLSEAKTILEGRGAAAEAAVINRWLSRLAVSG